MPNVPAATQALDILKLMGRQAAPMPATAIARELELPRSTTYHLLSAMTAAGFVIHLADQRRYGLGPSAYELGFAYTRQDPLRWVALPALGDLVARTGQYGHFAVLDARDVVYVVEERPPGRPSLVTDVGVRLPAHLTASGLSILAALPPAQLRALYTSPAALTRREGRGPRTLAELRRQLAQVRDDGFATEHESVTPGYASVALPVLDHRGYPVGAVTLTLPAAQASAKRMAGLADEARRTATTIARRVGSR